jgi:ATP-dependent DNA helicase DinG
LADVPSPDLLSHADSSEIPDLATLLATAVEAVGGKERPGQVRMAEAVEASIGSGEHLAVQAGTGTGKSLAYLVPAVRHAVTTGRTVVVSTATIALQRQLVDRDLPRLAEALKPLVGEVRFAILKGRRNYLCLHRVQVGAPEDSEDGLFDDPAATSALGKQVKRVYDWAEETVTGDRDEIVPGVTEQAWRQFSVTARECLGAQRCPHGTDCFAEQARGRAGEAHIVVTNHALLAIDALEEFKVLPEHDVVIVDEAHDLVDRVTSVATGELSAAAVDTAARRCGRLIEESFADRLKESAEGLSLLLEDLPAGRLDVLPQPLANTLTVLRDAAHACLTALGPEQKDADPADMAMRRAARSSVEEIHDTAVRLLTSYETDIAHRRDVVWAEKPFTPAGALPGQERRRPPALHVAPIEVGGLLRTTLFGTRTTVLTSATLTLGGSFDPLARQWGLPPATNRAVRTSGQDSVSGEGTHASPAGEAGGASDGGASDGGASEGGASGGGAEVSDGGEGGGTEGSGGRRGSGDERELVWSGIDVGSPFDHPRAGILYVARHLPQPGRDGLAAEYLTELAELIEAAGGRTLGLFSSMRAARQAAEELRKRVSFTVLCQGDDSTSQLVKRFAEETETCLFGTLSLWQGVDVPGPSLQLVVMDRIPFPRPDDPVSSARQRSVAAHGGNGFMAVAATGAALLLAQGAGRLLRSMDDKGVVAVLDPRLVTARYGSFLKASLPPFWTTTDPAVVRAALKRLNASS